VAEETPNIQAFRAFAAAWNALDLEGIVQAFAPNGVYHNMPTDPLQGRDNIRELVKPWMETLSRMRWTIHNIVEAPSGLVFAERTDSFVMNGKSCDLPCNGVFEFRDGLIAVWRDYYDQASVERAMIA
jgi:limonene-1,2-epoxide hydrolase